MFYSQISFFRSKNEYHRIYEQQTRLQHHMYIFLMYNIGDKDFFGQDMQQVIHKPLFSIQRMQQVHCELHSMTRYIFVPVSEQSTWVLDLFILISLVILFLTSTYSVFIHCKLSDNYFAYQQAVTERKQINCNLIFFYFFNVVQQRLLCIRFVTLCIPRQGE